MKLLFGFGYLLSKVMAPGQLSVLMYHGAISKPLSLPDTCFIRVNEFSEQMQWLEDMKVDVLPLLEAVAALCENRLRRPTVVLTFDDGYRNNRTHVLPILERHGFPATIYLTTGFTGTDRTLWPSRLNLALSRTRLRSLNWAGNTIPLASQTEREAALPFIQELVKRVAGDSPDDAVTEIETLLETGRQCVDFESPFAMMNADDVRACLNSGLIEFGAHTVRHPLLARLDDHRLSDEINTSIDAVEALTGKPCRSFAYPNGHEADFDSRAIERLHDRGVHVAVTAIKGPNRSNADPMRIRRWGIGPAVSRKRFGGVALNMAPEAIKANLRYRFGLASARTGL